MTVGGSNEEAHADNEDNCTVVPLANHMARPVLQESEYRPLVPYVMCVIF